MRLRPPQGLVARTTHGALDLSAVAALAGEVSLPERALKAELTFDGPIRAVLLVENLGAFCDLPSIDGWLLVHVPGWDTATVVRLLQHLVSVHVVHFGDLDPNGVRIVQHLRGIRPDLRWFVPAFWEEFIEVNGLAGIWPDNLDLTAAPDLVQRLASRAMWLEQERIVLDPRIPIALEAVL